jgi:membrane protease YdiL (CAAX protease family)
LSFEKSKPDVLIAFAFFAFSVATAYFQPINPLFYISPFLHSLEMSSFSEMLLEGSILLLFWLAVIGAILWLRRQRLDTVGITGANLKLCILMGSMASLPFLLINASIGLWQAPGFILFFLIGGFCEEIMYRGFFQTRLASYFGELNGFILASSLFAIAHIPSWIGIARSVELFSGIIMLLGWTIFSCYLFGWMFYKSKSILPSTITHSLFNFCFVAYIML